MHPKNAFGTLFQLAEFNPLDWINPGYVPKSYQEFVKEKEKQNHSKGKIETSRIDEDGESILELTQGEVSIRVYQKDLPELIERLKMMADK